MIQYFLRIITYISRIAWELPRILIYILYSLNAPPSLDRYQIDQLEANFSYERGPSIKLYTLPDLLVWALLSMIDKIIQSKIID